MMFMVMMRMVMACVVRSRRLYMVMRRYVCMMRSIGNRMIESAANISAANISAAKISAAKVSAKIV